MAFGTVHLDRYVEGRSALHLADARVKLPVALGFIAARVVYVYLYITNQASARTLAWTAAWLCNLAIFLSPLAK